MKKGCELMGKFMFLIGAEYFPHFLYMRPIIEKYSINGELDFHRFEMNALLGRNKGRKVESVFDDDLNVLDKSRQYKLIALFSYSLSVPMSLCATLYLFIICFLKKITSNNSFFYNFLRVSLHGIVIGDCICGIFLRFYSPHGKIVFNYHMVKVARQVCHQFYAANLFLILINFFNKKEKGHFMSQELTYLDELKRRILLKKGYIELRLNYTSGKFEPYIKNTNFNSIATEEFNAISNNNFDYDMAEKSINKFVFRENKYLQLADCDVSKDVRLQLNDLKNISFSPNKKIAVIFLHQVSDAAYLFGVDCFDDLDQWLFETIKILSVYNFLVIIKIHPAYFSKKLTYPIDNKYAQYLEGIFDVKFNLMSQNGIHKSSFENVVFVHHSVPASELSRCFPDFLCITHHGTVACEAAYLGHTVMVSNASPYINSHKFVNIYQSTFEYRLLVESWISGGLRQNEYSKETLLKYFFNRTNPCDMELKLEQFREFLGYSRESDNEFLNYLKGVSRSSAEYIRIVEYLRESV